MSMLSTRRASTRFATAALLTPVVVLTIVLAVAIPASAVPFTSDDVGGTGVAARTNATALRVDWAAAVTAQGWTVEPPAVITAASTGTAISGVVATTPLGTTVSVQRARYSSSAVAPEFVELSTNPGIANCNASGEQMQDSSPRPSVLVGNSGCSNGNGFAYSFFGGTGENTTRDAVEFTFSRAVSAFGAWFGDLETRTDGSGVPAIARVYGLDGLLLDEWQVEPTVADQTTCGTVPRVCGNNTTMWVGWVGAPITRMVVIVGDDDTTGDALAEGISLIGPSTVDVVPSISVAAGPAPVGVYYAGDSVPFVFTVTNDSDVPLQLPLAADCVEPTLLPAGASTQCTVNQVVTQPQLDAGTVDVPFSIDGTWEGLSTSDATIAAVPLVQSVAFGIDLSANVTEVDTIGDEIEFTSQITNLGNVSGIPTSVELDGNPLACLPLTPVAPGASFTCTDTVTVSTPESVAAQSTVTWTSGGASSDASDSALVPWAGPTDPDFGQLPTLPNPGNPGFSQLPALGAEDDVVWWMLAAGGLIMVGAGALVVPRVIARRKAQAARANSPRRSARS